MSNFSENFTIQIQDSLTDRGRTHGISTSGKAYEVIGALPNEEVEAFTIRSSNRKKVALTLKVLKPSEDRVSAKCRHVPSCGGCTLQIMRYEKQLLWKQRNIEKLFEKFGIAVYSIIGSDIWQYRDKMEFSFSEDKAGNRYLGLILAGSKGKVFNVEECFLVNPWMGNFLKEVRVFWEQSGLKAYHGTSNTGSLRTLTLREGLRTGEKMVNLTVSGNPEYALSHEHIKSLKRLVSESLIDASLFLTIHQIAKGVPTQFFEMHLQGKDHIQEKLIVGQKEYTFKISPSSFFQPNPAQAEKIYSKALDLIGEGEHALDLFSGTSTFSIMLARKFQRVSAIEINPHAVFDAAVNLEVNGVTNVRLIQGDVAEKLLELDGKVDLVALDPPRAGCGKKGLEIVLKLKAPKILYISCNPATQALDVEALILGGYRLVHIQPVDQFPHTMHCENICVLEYLG